FSIVSHFIVSFFYFFFSSRRRHTRCYRDWSSDVCSSDLSQLLGLLVQTVSRGDEGHHRRVRRSQGSAPAGAGDQLDGSRAEEGCTPVPGRLPNALSCAARRERQCSQELCATRCANVIVHTRTRNRA